MTDLTDAVRLNIQNLSAALDLKKLEVVSEEIGKCKIITDDLSIQIYLDPRGSSISSSVIFLDSEDLFKEELYTHVLVSLFDNCIPNVRKPMSIVDRVGVELSNVSEILSEMRNNGFNARDLFFFRRGHSAGYTDSVSF